MRNHDPLPDLLSVSEAALYLDVHPNTIKRWLKNGTIPGSRLGVKWYISADALSKVLNRRGEAA